MTEGIFIAMPVYRGAEVIGETVRSIKAQTFRDFHLVMSVDGSDDPTVEVCRKYTDDPRIDLAVQEERLGWPGNFNWLVEQRDREFFCYWQQDDLASAGYLENLRRELLSRPDASIAYTDVQWFGAAYHRDSTPGIAGDPLSRVMQHIEAIRFEPLRGLMRSNKLPKGPNAIPVTEDESCQEEFVLLTNMAAAGPFVRIDSAMYFKRLHSANAFVRWRHFPDWRRRRGWISMGVGMYTVAQDLADESIRPRILAQVLDRLAVNRPGRGFFYQPEQTPEELGRFVRDFVAYAGITADDLPNAEQGIYPLERQVHPEIKRALWAERSHADERQLLANQRRVAERVIDFGGSQGQALLGYGWSHPESWGVWTVGSEATLRIPVPPETTWSVTLEGQLYAPQGAAKIGYSLPGGRISYLTVSNGKPFDLKVDGVADKGGMVRLHLPDARSPQDEGLSGDGRVLGYALSRIRLEPRE